MSAPDTRPTWVRWRILAILLAFSFMSWLNRVSLAVAYDERMKDQFRISETEIGLVYSALLFAYMLCMTPGGWLADRRGAWLALTIMGIGSACFVGMTGGVAYAALSASAMVSALLVVRIALGVFTAPIYPASGRAIAHWFPSGQRAWANGMVMAAALVGIASSFHLFGGMIDQLGRNWPAAFFVTGTLTAGFALIWALYATNRPTGHVGVNAAEVRLIEGSVPEKQRPAATAITATPPEGEGWWSLLGNRSLVMITLSYAAIGYFEYLFYFWMHYYFKEKLHMSDADSRTYATIGNLAMAGGMFAGGWLADVLARVRGRRFGRTAVVVGGMLGGAVLLGIGLTTKQPEWIAFWFSLAMAAVGATEGPFWATALELGGRQGATAAGIFNTGGNAGGVVAPLLTPVASAAFAKMFGEQYGWTGAISLGGLVCLVGAFLWLWIKPPETLHESGNS